MAEYYGENEDEEDEDGVEGGAGGGVGGCEGEVCGMSELLIVVREGESGRRGGKEDSQIVRTMVSNVPKTRQPMIFRLIFGSVT